MSWRQVYLKPGKLKAGLSIAFFCPLRYLIMLLNFAFCNNNQLITCHTYQLAYYLSYSPVYTMLRFPRLSQEEKRAEWEVSIRQNIHGDVLEKGKCKI